MRARSGTARAGAGGDDVDPMITIGLTGGIGSGKSTVSAMLAQRGAYVLSADQVGHEAYLPQGPAWQEVVAAFGPDILGPAGDIDRQRLGTIVFADPAALARLNAIMHPKMYRMMEERLAGLRMRAIPVAVVEAALLFEAKWTPLVDRIWVTWAPEAVVVERLCRRNNVEPEEARRRMASQMPPEEKVRQAHVVIDTNCSLEELERRVADLWAALPQGVHAR